MSSFKTVIGGLMSFLALTGVALGADPPPGHEPLEVRKTIAPLRRAGLN